MSRLNDEAPGLAQAIIRQMLGDNPNGPRVWRLVAARMAGDYEAPAAWRQLGGDRETVQGVLDMIRQSFEQALKEGKRPTAKDERDDINRVIQLAKELRLAVKTSSLPANRLEFGRVLAGEEGLPEVNVDFGWHSVTLDQSIGGRWLTLEEVLGWAIESATGHLEALPTRAVQRKSRSRDPEITAFVRHLAWHFLRSFGQEMRGTIGRIASAVFALPEPLNEANVEAMLKDRPAAFKARPPA